MQGLEDRGTLLIYTRLHTWVAGLANWRRPGELAKILSPGTAARHVSSTMIVSAISVQLLATLGISISLVYMILMDAKAIYQALRKGELVLFGITCMVFGKDKKYNNKYKKRLQDPALIAAQLQQGGGTTKRLIFIRHGESLWNEVFNRGFHPIKFPLRLVKALLRESTMAFKNDSLFFDSPLNFEGVEQAKNLRRYLANPEAYPEYPYSSDVQALRGDANARSAVLVSSILRRATQTIVIVRHRAAAALESRLAAPSSLTTQNPCVWPHAGVVGSHQAAQGAPAHPVSAARDLDQRRHARSRRASYRA